MTRFRAYTTDSDEDDEVLVKTPAKPVVPVREIQEDEELSNDSSSSDSEMLDAELLISPVKHKQYLKKGLVQGKAGEYYDKREERPEIPTDVSSSESESEEEHEPSSRLNSRNPIDPSIIPWARHVGVEPQKMHVMQTSLFRMPEEAAALENATQPRRLLSHLTNINMPRKHSRDSDGEGLRVDLQQVRFTVFIN
jgi:nuclear pore complex protein Nup98-Nup96